MNSEPILLADVLPALPKELQELLENKGESSLTSQVSSLRIVDRCRCGDDFCGSFYTQPKPAGAYGPNHCSMDLDAAKGMIVLDVVNGLIAHVEVLNRNEIRQKLLEALP